MLGNIINLKYRSLAIIRWNNYPRVQDYVESEHISLKLNIAYILTSIIRDSGNDVDLFYIYKHIYWSSFFTFVYSDIKYDIKTNLKEKNPTIYKKLRKKLFDFLKNIDLDSKITNDFKLIFDKHIQGDLFNKDYKIEHDIISLTKAIEKKLEIKDNIQFYGLSYGSILENIEKDIKYFSNKLGFRHIKTVDIYLSHLIKLKFAYRWNRNQRLYPVSVLSHLFFVFSFSYFLGLLKGFSNKKMEEILNISLLHDLPEALTGDIITPTKISVPGFKDALEKIEETVVDDKLIRFFDEFGFKKDFRRYVLYPFDDKMGKIAKYSDKLSAMFEAKIENKESTLRIYKDIKNSLWLKNDKELDYILKYGVDYFEEDIEEKWKSFIGINY